MGEHGENDTVAGRPSLVSYGRRRVVTLRLRHGHVLQGLRKSFRLGAPTSNLVTAVAAVPMRALPDRHSMVGARRANRPSAFPMVAGPPTVALGREEQEA